MPWKTGDNGFIQTNHIPPAIPSDGPRPPPGLWSKGSQTPEQRQAEEAARHAVVAQAVKERQEADVRRAQEREQAQKAAATAALQAEHDRQLGAWQSAGGDASDFEKAWRGELRQAYLIGVVKAGDSQHERLVAEAREAMRHNHRYAGLST